MAEVTFPAPVTRESWLDRPILPAWQRLAALTVHWELLAYSALVLAGLLLRIWDVGGRAMHHDESLHAYYAWQPYAGKADYTYDPLMHGPFQFEVVPLFYLLFGDSEFSARLLAVVLGTVLIVLPYFLRRYITPQGALVTALMLSVSPSFVYFSRFIRDDIYLACFSLILFIAIVHYVDNPRPAYLYVAAAAMALAMASMEAAYITFFIFGSFLAFEALREFVSSRDGPILRAFRTTSLDVWLMALSIFVILTVLMYSSFFQNPNGIWDSKHPLCLKDCLTTHPQWNTARKDILGGIAYWLAQHTYERGGQPWFYYLLVIPLYEQLAVLFGLAGLVYAAIRRSMFITFLAWWAILALVVYSWAGEKMPWLSIHIDLPFILLAGSFMGAVLTWRRIVPFLLAGASFFLLLALEIHSTFLFNYVDAANPTEMLIYVQTSQDVPRVVQEIQALSRRPGMGGTSMQIGLDNADVGGWPFTWYLRQYPNVIETSSFSGPLCSGSSAPTGIRVGLSQQQYCPVVLMLEPEFNQYQAQLMKHYVVQKYRWNWWFPEDYKQWFPDHWSNIPQALQGNGSLSQDLFGTPDDRSHLWDWLMYRRPFGDRGARWLYFLVRRDLVPNAKQYSTHFAAPAQPTSPGSAPQINAPSIPAVLVSSHIGLGRLEGPRGLAAAPNGDFYAADTLDHRVVMFSAKGTFRKSWGQVGTAPGDFNANSSPMGLGVAPNGLVYVADTWNQRIQVFSPTGQFLRAWGGGPIGSGNGQFYGPRSVAVGRNGRVYVADTGNKRIQVFTNSGRFVSTWGTPGTAPGQFNEPSSVAIGPQGTVYVSDFWNQRIQAFTSTGTYLNSWPVSDWSPQSYDEPYLAVDQKSGRVYATDPQQAKVLVFTTSGQLVGAVGATHLSLPIGLAVQANGRLLVSDSTANELSAYKVHTRRLAPTGTARPPRSSHYGIVKKP